MPTPTANISGDINAAIGEVTTIRATVVYSDPVWADETNNAVIVGGGVIPVSPTGGIDVDLPQTTDTVRVAINLEYVDNATRQRRSETSGWQELTADIDLATFMAMTPTSVPQSTAEALAARIDGYTDHGDVSGAVTFNGPTGSHWFDATAATTIALDGFTEGQVVSLLPFSGAADVTVTGLPDLELADGLISSAMLARGVWVTGGGGGGTPATPDETPPTAVTDLTATGGEEEIVLDWSAATDTETSVSYRYRAWLTSEGASGTWTTTTATAATITGLAAGDYTAEVYAYSNGGASATDTDTATVTEPLTYDIGDDFESANTSNINGRNTPVGAKTWTTPWNTPLAFGGGLGITSGKLSGSDSARVTPDQQDYIVSCTYDVTSGSAQVRLFARANETDAAASSASSVQAVIRSNGNIEVDRGNDYSLGVRGTGAPTTGTLALEVIGTTGRVLVNGTPVGASFSVSGVTGLHAGIGQLNATTDNFQIEYL